MARLTLEQVQQVAELAALRLDPQEAEAMRGDLGAFLDHLEALEALDVTGIEPTFHPVPLPKDLREDVVQPSIPREVVLRAAPETEHGGFAVPRVLDGDG